MEFSGFSAPKCEKTPHVETLVGDTARSGSMARDWRGDLKMVALAAAQSVEVCVDLIYYSFLQSTVHYNDNANSTQFRSHIA